MKEGRQMACKGRGKSEAISPLSRKQLLPASKLPTAVKVQASTPWRLSQSGFVMSVGGVLV